MAYKYKWKPSASQRRAFAEKMKDPDEQAAYELRKRQRREKDFESSFTKGIRSYVPTKEQHDFATFNRPDDMTPEQEDACNQVASAFDCMDKIDHTYIHIVNEMRRKAFSSM